MREMRFNNNVHHSGVNVTVRRGPKWSDLEKDDLLRLSSPTGDSLRIAKVITSMKMLFHSIPMSLLSHGHDPACRSRIGLLKKMKKAYPGFRSSEEVTVVMYWLNEEQP